MAVPIEAIWHEGPYSVYKCLNPSFYDKDIVYEVYKDTPGPTPIGEFDNPEDAIRYAEMHRDTGA